MASEERYHLILVDSPLELVPEVLWEGKDVRNDAGRRGRRPGEILLDISKHYSSMKRVGFVDGRGRPDIIHTALLTTLDSPLNQMERLRTYIHTLHDTVIYVDPRLRAPRSYERFEGLLAKLLMVGHIPDEKPYLLSVQRASLRKFLRDLAPETVVALSRGGDPVPIHQVLSGKDIALMIGAFQKGAFSRQVRALADRVVSLGPYPLSTHVAVCQVLHELEFLLRSGAAAGI
ncbi:MAG: ribosome biogenesis protein [Candidatus Geothermarchaeales archaeon]